MKFFITIDPPGTQRRDDGFYWDPEQRSLKVYLAAPALHVNISADDLVGLVQSRDDVRGWADRAEILADFSRGSLDHQSVNKAIEMCFTFDEEGDVSLDKVSLVHDAICAANLPSKPSNLYAFRDLKELLVKRSGGDVVAQIMVLAKSFLGRWAEENQIPLLRPDPRGSNFTSPLRRKEDFINQINIVEFLKGNQPPIDAQSMDLLSKLDAKQEISRLMRGGTQRAGYVGRVNQVLRLLLSHPDLVSNRKLGKFLAPLVGMHDSGQVLRRLLPFKDVPQVRPTFQWLIAANPEFIENEWMKVSEGGDLFDRTKNQWLHEAQDVGQFTFASILEKGYQGKEPEIALRNWAALRGTEVVFKDWDKGLGRRVLYAKCDDPLLEGHSVEVLKPEIASSRQEASVRLIHRICETCGLI